MTNPPPVRYAAEKWFLRKGLPFVLRPGVLVRQVWGRSAPAFAGLAVVSLNSVLLVGLTGKHTIDVGGTPTRTEWFVLGLLVLVLPVAVLVGWWVSRIEGLRSRDIASTVAFVASCVGAALGGPTPYPLRNVVYTVIVVAIMLCATATGVGSILGWAVRMVGTNLAASASLFVRALPVVLLTVLVFFNGYVWLMAALVSRPRLWLALLFLFGIAVAFLVTSTMERVHPILAPDAKVPADAARLEGTPFAELPDRPRRVPLSRAERSNVILVLGLSQTVQVMTVAVSTAMLFFVLGMILLSPELLEAWTRGSRSDGEFLGMTLPIPQSLIQMTMFLAALTFMYLSARAVSDPEQRERFLDPLVDDLRLTLVARDRYRAATADKGTS